MSNRAVVSAVAEAATAEARACGMAEAGAEVGFGLAEEFGILPGR